jgi:hypothetical protein
MWIKIKYSIENVTFLIREKKGFAIIVLDKIAIYVSSGAM